MSKASTTTKLKAAVIKTTSLAVGGGDTETFKNDAEKKLSYMSRFSYAIEMMRSIIDHKKVFVLALNGPGVGGGAAWFQGVSDIVLAAQGAWLQVPFNALGLVPENGSAISFAQSMGVHRANDFLMFGRKCTVEEMEQWGMVNRLFPAEGFHQSVIKFLEEQLEVNDGKSMMETKRLQNAPRRSERMMAVFDAMEALAERFVEGAPAQRFVDKKALLEGKIIEAFPSILLTLLIQLSRRTDPNCHNAQRKRACLNLTHRMWYGTIHS